jgi:ABC-type uncharacterized transport system YnjBCD ATPase subunit
VSVVRRVREALEFVELWEYRRKAVADISGGVQRRLQLAAATGYDLELLFVDEPTANLDPSSGAGFGKSSAAYAKGDVRSSSPPSTWAKPSFATARASCPTVPRSPWALPTN